MSDPCVRLETPATGPARVVFDEPGRPVNVLRQEVFEQLSGVLDQIEALRPAPPQVHLVSGKPGTFIAGADLKVIRDAPDAELDGVLKQGQDVLDRLAGLPMPTVALIGGAALGGGLEVALACDLRVAAEGDRPTLGLPEINLGLVPGWGGTVRLPRCIGADAATPMLLAGRVVTPHEAHELGLVDAVAPADALEETALSLETKPSAPTHDDWQVVLDRHQDQLAEIEPLKQPAAQGMLATLDAGLGEGPQAGFDAERRHLVALRNTDEGKALIAAFFDKRKKK